MAERDFNKWWSEYCQISALNDIGLYFIDAEILKAEMKCAFLRRLPTEREIVDAKSRIASRRKLP